LRRKWPQSVPNGLPSWAYNIPDKVQAPRAEATGPVHLPGTTKVYDAVEVASSANPPDWFPNEHGAAPRIVKDETGMTKMACGSCHLMSGQGHPESADIAGLPAEYIVRQMSYSKAGRGKMTIVWVPLQKSRPRKMCGKQPIIFAAIKPIAWVKVIETATPPKTYVSTAARHRLVVPGGGTEPIGHRIIEIPEDPFRTANRDPHSPFLAYVPPGVSITKGEALVKAGGSGKTIQCVICHGDELKVSVKCPELLACSRSISQRNSSASRTDQSAGTARR